MYVSSRMVREGTRRYAKVRGGTRVGAWGILLMHRGLTKRALWRWFLSGPSLYPLPALRHSSRASLTTDFVFAPVPHQSRERFDLRFPRFTNLGDHPRVFGEPTAHHVPTSSDCSSFFPGVRIRFQHPVTPYYDRQYPPPRGTTTTTGSTISNWPLRSVFTGHSRV